MLVSEKRIEIPDTCPKECPEPESPWYQCQNGLCYRCPVLICKKNTDDGLCLVAPEDYRPDWAKEFRAWFDSNCASDHRPKLRLRGEEGVKQ